MFKSYTKLLWIRQWVPKTIFQGAATRKRLGNTIGFLVSISRTLSAENPFVFFHNFSFLFAAKVMCFDFSCHYVNAFDIKVLFFLQDCHLQQQCCC